MSFESISPKFLSSIRPRHLPQLNISGVPAYSPLRYEFHSRSWIQTLKFQMALPMKDKSYLDLLAEYVSKQMIHPTKAIVPIPSHPIRSLCQVDLSWEWAQALSKALEVPVLHNFLQGPPLLEAFWHKTQKDLSARERLDREKKIKRFRISPHKINCSLDGILLSDDVFNTGSSFRSALQTIEEAGHSVSSACLLALTPQAELLRML